MTDAEIPTLPDDPSELTPKEHWPPLRERRIPWTDTAFLYAHRRSMDGLSFFRAIADGTLPPAPLYEAYGFSLETVEDGASMVAITPHDWIYNPLGTVHGGLLATMIDTATGIAVQSQLPAGQLSNTVQLHVDFIRAIGATTGRLECRATVAKPGRQIAIADAEITGEDGKIYGRGSGTFMTLENKPQADADAPATDPPAPAERIARAPDPSYLAGAARRMSATEFLQGMATGELPPPTIGATIGFRLASVNEGHAEFRCTPKPYHYNPLGSVHGGLAATLIDSATGCAVQTVLDDGEGFTTVSLTVDFFRPVTLETGPLFCPGWVVKNGRKLVIADSEVRDADGKVYARGAATCLRFRFKDVDGRR